MKVLQVHEKVEIKGGAEIYIRQLTSLLPTFGIPTIWVGLYNKGDLYKVVNQVNEEIFSCRKKQELQNFFLRFLEDNKIDLINIHNLFDKDLVRILLELRPIVKSVHSPVMVCPGRDKFWRFSERPCTIRYGLHCFYHIYAEGCSNRHPKRVKKAWDYVQFEMNEASLKYKKIIVMSNFMRDGLLECGVEASNIFVNPYFTPIVSNGSISNCVNSIPKLKRLLFVGRLVSSKGPHIMISALAEVLREMPDIMLDIIGDGLMKDELISQVNSLGLQNKIVFHGWKEHEEIDRMMRESYLVLFPSVYPEAFGIVGIEAMMRNKPVVAFDVGGVNTWLKDGINGFLVPVKDEKVFKSKVLYLINSPDKYSSFCKNARDLAIKIFTPDVHILELTKIYKLSLFQN